MSRAEPLALPLVLFALCVAGVAHLEPRLATELHAIKDTDDVYPFPPPVVLRLATLGYVDATTDILWGKLLVENGSHWGEHRPFGDLEHYLEAIHHLDPLYWPFYDYVDSLLCYRPMNGHEPDARLAREYLLEGTKLMPTNPEIWRKFGQFVAFMGPSYLADQKEKEAWKKEGALALEHAVELGADMQLGFAASTMLNSRLGERQAAVDFLLRAYATADDEATRAEIAAKLAIYGASARRDWEEEVVETVRARRRSEYPFLKPDLYLLVGPVPEKDRCAGPESALESECARDWAAVLPKDPSR